MSFGLRQFSRDSCVWFSSWCGPAWPLGPGSRQRCSFLMRKSAPVRLELTLFSCPPDGVCGGCAATCKCLSRVSHEGVASSQGSGGCGHQMLSTMLLLHVTVADRCARVLRRLSSHLYLHMISRSHLGTSGSPAWPISGTSAEASWICFTECARRAIRTTRNLTHRPLRTWRTR